MANKTINLDIEGMTCGHCVMHVKAALKSVKGVKKADVDLLSKSAKVVLKNDEVDPKILISAVADAGYSANKK